MYLAWRRKVQGVGKIIALVVVASVALSALSSVINNVHTVPLFGQGGGDDDGGVPGGSDIAHASLSKVENDISSMTAEQLNTTVFNLLGTPGTAYIRTAVMTDYAGGTWSSFGSERVTFFGEASVDIPAVEGVRRSTSIVTVSPSKTVTGGIPTFKDTYVLRCSNEIGYYPEFGTFTTAGRITDSYLCTFYVSHYYQGILANASAPDDIRYLGVPSTLAEDLSSMADFVTAGKNSPYEKALALRDFLRLGYIYDQKYEHAPAGEDPVIWFLLHGKKGVCSQFNSALTLLARSVGIPARYVTGYVVNPDAMFQNIRLAQAHAYTEIELDGIGWVLLDAAPLSFTDPFQLEPETGDWKDDIVTSEEPKNDTLARIAGWISQPSPENDPYGYYEMPVYGIDLALYNDSELVRVTQTNLMGNFRFTDLEWGNYTLMPLLADRWTAIGMDRIELPCHAFSFHVVHFLVKPEPVNPLGEATTAELWCSDLSLEQRTGFAVNGTVRNLLGDVLEGSFVQILIDNATTGELCACGQGIVVDGSFDVGCVVPDGIATGGHRLVARTLGNDTYAPSEASTSASLSDFSTLILSAPSRMPQGVPVKFSLRLIEGRSGLPIPQATIELGGIAPDPVTDEYGNANFTLTYISPGTQDVSAEYAGNGYLSGSNATIRFSVIALQAEVLTETLVRGEPNLVVGRVYANNIPAGDVNVTLRPLFEGGPECNNTTNEFGYFFVTVELPKTGISRGPKEVNMWLANCTEANWTVRIKDRPRLATSASGGSAAITLVGPSSEPIPGVMITVSAGNATIYTITDSRGSTEVGVPQGSESVKAIFAGNEEYASAYAEAAVAPAGFDWSFLPWVIAGSCAVGVGAGSAYTRWSRRKEMRPESPPLPDEIGGPYGIEFPQIERGFPAKWGLDEQLVVAVKGRTEGARLVVDGVDVPLVVKGESTAEATLLLPLGRHEIIVSGREGRSMRAIHIVDYREEVARLYREALDALAPLAPGVTYDKTPREVQAVAAVRVPGSCLIALDVAVSRFEVAGFSDHTFGREGYAEMEVAVEAIKAQCSRRPAG